MSKPWRVGRSYGIHVYEGNRPVATFLSAKRAAQAVYAVNTEESLRSRLLYAEERRDHYIHEAQRLAEKVRELGGDPG